MRMSELEQPPNLNNLAVDEIFSNAFFEHDVDVDPAQFNKLLQMWIKYQSEQRPEAQQRTRKLQEDIKTLDIELRRLKTEVSMHRAIIDELGFRINSTPFEGHLDEILNYVIKAFKELDFATEIHYAPLENGIFELTVIHAMEDKVNALESIYKKFLRVENAFSDVRFEMTLLHTDEIQPDHLMGTKSVFQKV